MKFVENIKQTILNVFESYKKFPKRIHGQLLGYILISGICTYALSLTVIYALQSVFTYRVLEINDFLLEVLIFNSDSGILFNGLMVLNFGILGRSISNKNFNPKTFSIFYPFKVLNTKEWNLIFILGSITIGISCVLISLSAEYFMSFDRGGLRMMLDIMPMLAKYQFYVWLSGFSYLILYLLPILLAGIFITYDDQIKFSIKLIKKNITFILTGVILFIAADVLLDSLYSGIYKYIGKLFYIPFENYSIPVIILVGLKIFIYMYMILGFATLLSGNYSYSKVIKIITQNDDSILDSEE